MKESAKWNTSDAWWLLAGPVTGIVGGTVLGAMLGWLTTPAEGVGPLVGNPVESSILGALVGMTLGVLSGAVVGAVLMLLVPRGRPTSTARPLAAGVAAMCCPAVLVLASSIGRIDLSQLDVTSFVVVAGAGAGAFAWVAGRTPDRL
ncbi:hypothetical protein [Nocardioides sp. SYSU D00065]|uniref:hypothetical protein n=1 Tax=Nocardioides sp. SYSU D00065 TaxID=2817378 RepID=UPI001B31D358|nr:hypothetical protein [Nocardioides sp. SYSU D00065]